VDIGFFNMLKPFEIKLLESLLDREPNVNGDSHLGKYGY
jgi:hypothetical protein